MKTLRLLLLLCLALSTSVQAREYLLMARSTQDFPETMLALQTAMQEHGYTVSRVQRVDIGLTASGYKTDKYRVVFFGKAKEQASMVKRYPDLIPYLPLKMTVLAENDETVVVTIDPMVFAGISKDPAYLDQLLRWRNDFLSILSEVRKD